MLVLIISSTIVNCLFLFLCYYFGIWKKMPVFCALVAFVIGFTMVFLIGNAFEGYDLVERSFFALIFGVLNVQMFWVVQNYVYRSL